MTEHKDKELNLNHGDYLVLGGWEYYWRKPRKVCFKFRCGPVPYVHRCKWHKNVFYKAPAYIGMRREYWKAIYDEISLRQKWVEIPDPWEDYYRERSKSWKKYRKTQYK